MIHRDDATSNVKTDYIRAAGLTIARIKGTEVSYMHQDHLGSAVASTTSTGAIAWREDYTPYGEKRVDPNGNKDDEGFTGHIDDAASGLTYMQARYYDPVIGRFLSNDPVGFHLGNLSSLNRYAYAINNPTNMFDPNGEDSVVKVDADKNVSITIPVIVSCDAAGDLAAIKAQGEAALTQKVGEFSVTTTIVAVTAADNPYSVANDLALTSGPTNPPPSGRTGRNPGGHSYYDPGTKTTNSTIAISGTDRANKPIIRGSVQTTSARTGSAGTVGHEFGHAAGIEQESKLPGNLMSPGSGTIITPAQLQEIFNNPNNDVTRCDVDDCSGD